MTRTAAARAIELPDHLPAIELPRRRLALVTASLLLSQTLSAFDTSIVMTAMPRIVAELAGLDLYAWVAIANLVTMTAIIPISGKLGDRFGRKRFLQIGIVGFVAASMLAGLSSSMTQLLAARAVQGLFTGLVVSSSLASLADLYLPATRARMQGVFMTAFAFASISGPIVGGVLTDQLGWRSIFYFFVPLGVLASVAVAVTVPHLEPERTDEKLDVVGGLLLVTGLIPLLVALSASRAVGVPASAVVAMFAFAAVLLALFAWTETRAADPVIPFAMFRDPTVIVSVVVSSLAMFAMFGSNIFIPLLYQGLLGASATESGVYLGPRVLGMVGASLVSGQLITRTDRYRFVGVAGLAALAVSLFLLSRTTASSSEGDVMRALVLTGVGFGLTQPIYQNAVMSAVKRRYVGVATSQVQFARCVGQTLGVTVLGAVLAAQVGSAAGAPIAIGGAPTVPLASLQAGLSDVFLVATVAAAAAALVAVLMKEVPLRGRKGQAPATAMPAELGIVSQ